MGFGACREQHYEPFAINGSLQTALGCSAKQSVLENKSNGHRHDPALPSLYNKHTMTLAKFLHCVRTACIMRMQRLGYSPKNTCHLSGSTAKQQSPHEKNETAFNLPTLNMSFFHKVQLGKTQNPCFLTPLQCFVQWQEKAHMPTLNMPFFHKVQLVQTPDQRFLTPLQCFVRQQGKAHLATQQSVDWIIGPVSSLAPEG